MQTNIIWINVDLSETKKSVSDGKTLVANAITQKGVATSGTDSFQTIANNIASIETNPYTKNFSTTISKTFNGNSASQSVSMSGTLNVSESEKLPYLVLLRSTSGTTGVSSGATGYIDQFSDVISLSGSIVTFTRNLRLHYVGSGKQLVHNITYNITVFYK